MPSEPSKAQSNSGRAPTRAMTVNGDGNDDPNEKMVVAMHDLDGEKDDPSDKGHGHRGAFEWKLDGEGRHWW